MGDREHILPTSQSKRCDVCGSALLDDPCPGTPQSAVACFYIDMRRVENQLVKVAGRVNARCGDGVSFDAGDTLAAAIIRRIDSIEGGRTEESKEADLTDRLILEHATTFSFQGDSFQVEVTTDHEYDTGWALRYDEGVEEHKGFLMHNEPDPGYTWIDGEDLSPVVLDNLRKAVSLALDFTNDKITAPGQYGHKT